MVFDVITLGETLVRLSAPESTRIADATSLELAIGGSESNTAIGLARFGLSVCWLSRLPDNLLGRFVAGLMRKYDVNTEFVTWTDDDRIGLAFVEHDQDEADPQVLYDYYESAMSHIFPDHLPSELFLTGEARLFHTTGTTASLSLSARDTARRAATRAKAAGMSISFDLNYQGRQPSVEAARFSCEPFLRLADLIFASATDVRTLYGLQHISSPEQLLDLWAARYPQADVIITLGDQGAIGRDKSGHVYFQQAIAMENTTNIGLSDAFSAGVIYSLLDDNWQLERALRWGMAMMAEKSTIRGELPLVDLDAVRATAAI